MRVTRLDGDPARQAGAHPGRLPAEEVVVNPGRVHLWTPAVSARIQYAPSEMNTGHSGGTFRR
jgi:hypothetical protein